MEIKKTKSHIYCLKFNQKNQEEDEQQVQSYSKNDDNPLGSSIWNQSSLGSGMDSKQTAIRFISRKEDFVRSIHECVDTQNQMLQNRKKENIHIITSKFISPSNINRLINLFALKLKRNTSCSFNQKQILADPERKNTGRGTLLSHIYHLIYPILNLLVLVVFTLGLIFHEIYLTSFFFTIDLVYLIFTFLKLLLTLIFLQQTQYQNSLKNILSNKITFAVIIVNLFLSSLLLYLLCNHQLQAIPYISIAITIPFLWSSGEEIVKMIIHIITKLRLYSMVRHSLQGKYLVNFGIWTHLLAVALGIVANNSKELNWMSHLSSVEQESSSTIYFRSLFEAFSIALSAGIHFPTPTTQTEVHYFLLIRITTFIVSIRALFVIFNKFNTIAFKTSADYSVTLKKYAQSYSADIIKYLQVGQLFIQEQMKGTEVKDVLSTGLNIFQGFSQRICFELARKSSAKILTKDNILLDFNHEYDWLILGKGKLATISPSGRKLQQFFCGFDTDVSNSPILLNSSFLNKKLPNYRLQSKTTSIIYRIRDEDFREVVKMSQFEQELLWSQKDKHSLVPDQFEVTRCSNCQLKHSQFECPWMHYRPLAHMVIWRYQHMMKRQKTLTIKVQQQIIPRIRSSALKYYAHMSQIAEKIKQGVQLNQKKLKHPTTAFFSQIRKGAQPGTFNSYCNCKQFESKSEEDEVWIINVDQLHDFHYYFPKSNPSRLTLHLNIYDH